MTMKAATTAMTLSLSLSLSMTMRSRGTFLEYSQPPPTSFLVTQPRGHNRPIVMCFHVLSISNSIFLRFFFNCQKVTPALIAPPWSRTFQLSYNFVLPIKHILSSICCGEVTLIFDFSFIISVHYTRVTCFEIIIFSISDFLFYLTCFSSR